jgi:hypothetical protein
MRLLPTLVVLLALGLLAGIVHSETFIWVDPAGVTHMTDDPERVPPELREGRQHAPPAASSLWEGPLGTSTVRAGRSSDVGRARTERLIRGAVQDLQRGETARAAVALDAILRDEPTRPEPHWYLATLDRHRGRYDSAEAHLRAFLASAGDPLEVWRKTAAQRLAELEDERRLAESVSAEDPDGWSGLESVNFRIVLDPQLASISSDYARTALGYLEQARASVSQRLGALPEETMGVVFYGRGSYDQAHRRRFSFRTVGFFDGRIHVVSAAHPEAELRALLFHEYVHAIFREQTGGDRPYWWNEGLAELSERGSRKQPGLSRGERSTLRRRIEANDWIPLRRLAPSFSGLDDDEARAAYLEAAAAALWIEARTDRAQRATILRVLGSGRGEDAALRHVLGMDTDAIDAEVQAWIRSEFAPLSAKTALQ